MSVRLLFSRTPSAPMPVVLDKITVVDVDRPTAASAYIGVRLTVNHFAHILPLLGGSDVAILEPP